MSTLIQTQNPLWSTFPRLFDELLNDWNTGSMMRSATMPAVNVKETDDAFHVEVAAPGYTKDSFKVELDNDVLTISSEMRHEDENKNEQYTRREFSYQSFVRRFNLPENMVDADKIEAKYENGILRVYIPKLESARPKPVKTIKIG
ncbi:MAG: Hsp20/alpha crystallin family protein [Salibacteraceae bacterium]